MAENLLKHILLVLMRLKIVLIVLKLTIGGTFRTNSF